MTTFWLCVLGWCAGWMLFGRPHALPAAPGTSSDRSDPDRLGDGADAAPVRLSIVIPARNEATSLPLLLADLAGDRPEGTEVIVVDDSSTDTTAEIASSFPFVRLLSADPPPAGWNGKPWACHTGYTAAQGELICFLDADVRLAPGALAALVHRHGEDGGLVTVQPHHRTQRWWEQASALFNVIALMGTRAGGPGRSTAAFGPVLLASRRDWDTVGGHAAVAGSVVEDLALAGEFRRRGLAVRPWVGGRLVAFRMYPDGLRSLVQGWTKNFAMGAGATSPLRLLAIVLWLGGMGSTLGYAVDSLGGEVAPAAAAVMYALWVTQVGWMLSVVGRFAHWAAVLYPLLLVAFFAVFVNSLWATLVRRQVTWRGRAIAVRAGSS